MVKQDSITIPRRPNRTFDSEDEKDEKTDTLSSIPRLVKQPSFTVSKLSTRGALVSNDEKGGNGIDRRRQMVKQDSIAMPRRDTLSSMRHQAKQTSFTATKRQGQCSTEARLLFLYSTLAKALEVSGDLTDDACEERHPAMSMRRTRSI
jgi:hypothetical protein